MKPLVTIITATGDRHRTFDICRKYVTAQTYDGPVQWLVVDDGRTALDPPSECDYVRREPEQSDPEMTLTRNILAACPQIKGDLVIFMEDDDWYSPFYIETMVDALSAAVIAAPRSIYYYHIPAKRACYSDFAGAMTFSAFCQTGMRRALCGDLMKMCADDDGVQLLDRTFWKSVRQDWKHLFSLSDGHQLSVGMKGLPGRVRHKGAHDCYDRYDIDDHHEGGLRGLIGDDIENCRPWLGSAEK